MNILFIGDIVGKVGRKALTKNLNKIKKDFDIKFVIANGENISHGKGMNLNHYNFLTNIGVDCITLGNHYADREEIKDYIDSKNNICRPLNIKEEFPGVGSQVFNVNGISLRVTNLLCEAYLNFEVNDPYKSIEEVIKTDTSNIHIIDLHGESSGEKKALAYLLANKVSAVIGTHTHVQTNDAQILADSLLYITDVGMCGSYNSVIGTEKNSVIDRIILKKPNARFKYLEDDDSLFNAVVLQFDETNFKGIGIIPLNIINRKGE